MRTMKPVETASQAYARLEHDAANILKLVARELKAHGKKQAAEPANWGFPGDLAEVKGRMKQALSFLMGGEDEEANDRAIEARLTEMRNR